MHKAPAKGLVVKDKNTLALAVMMSLCDAFVMRKDAAGISIKVSLNVFGYECRASDEAAAVQEVGRWMCSLPKGVWEK